MNLVVDDAVEIKLATKTEDETRRELGMRSALINRKYTQKLTVWRHLGQILLKGDNVTCLACASIN